MSGILEEIRDQQARLLAGWDDLRRRLEALERAERLYAEWYTLPACARLKGVSPDFLRDHPEQQPGGGRGRHLIGGIMRWPRAAVAEWLAKDDDQLREHAEASHEEATA